MLPEGWKRTTFEDHIDLLSGNPFKSAEYSNDPTDIRLLRGDNIEPGKLRWRDAKFWPTDRIHNLTRYSLQQGDFVIAMDRTWVSSGLKVAEVRSADLPCLLVQRVSRIRALPTLCQSLLKQYFSGYPFENYVKSVETETAVPHISAQQIKDFPFLLPPLPEQKKIAAILSTWDRAIEGTEKLLANSQQQKKALMQQLLTGKKRLPGFTGEWKTRTLGEIGEISSAGVDKKIVDGEEPIRLLNFTDVFKKTFIYSDDLHQWVTAPSVKVQKCNVKKGDVFFTPSSETRNDIAFSAVAAENMQGCCYSYHVVRLRFKEKWDDAFKAFIFSTMSFRRQVYKLADGSGQRYVISQDDFRSIEITYPSLDEQCQIGAILRTAENEITALESDLSRLRQEKKALMQQLLTGKRRVTID